MSRKSRTNTEDRRAFLRKLAVAGGATAAVAMTGRAAVAAPGQDAPSADNENRGYRETPHVRSYYRTARL